MIGVWVNFGVVVLGGLIGCLLRGGIGEKYQQTINNGLGLCVICIGLGGALDTANMMIVIISVAVGALIGERLGIERGLDRLGNWAQKRFSRGDDGFSTGFVNATLLFCVGAMAVVGSLEAGLQNKADTLLAKSALDGVSSVIFASSFGPGVILAAIPLTLYQGGIAALSGILSPFLTDALINEMSAVGSVLIIAIGLNMMNLPRERIRVGNLLPAILVPCIYFPIAQWLSQLF